MVSVCKYLKDTEDTSFMYLYPVWRYNIFVSVATLGTAKIKAIHASPGPRYDGSPCTCNVCWHWQGLPRLRTPSQRGREGGKEGYIIHVKLLPLKN